MSNKKPYSKPGIVFEDFVTGELTGSPEMIDRIKRECAALQAQENVMPCPLDDTEFPCNLHSVRNI